MELPVYYDYQNAYNSRISPSTVHVKNTGLQWFFRRYLLQKIMSEAEFLKALSMNTEISNISVSAFTRPSETLKFAMCIIAAGPMLVIFPFFQKYFSQGLTIGAVKG